MTELFYIENEFLRAGISPLGAELRTLTDKSGNQEILKVEDDPDWDGCAPILFPICGRLWEQTTKINGTPYRMDIHGFASTSVFAVTEKAADRISLSISDTDEIRESTYPFRFTLTVTYSLLDRSIETRVTVGNPGSAALPFTVGFHPGFRMPLGGVGAFDDAYLEFSAPCTPALWRITEEGILLEGTDPLPLSDGIRLPISEQLFEANDSVFLAQIADAVTLKSTTSPIGIRLDYASAPFLGLWKPIGSTAFLCIEPWYGSPDFDGKITELFEKRDMHTLPAGENRDFTYRITLTSSSAE